MSLDRSFTVPYIGIVLQFCRVGPPTLYLLWCGSEINSCWVYLVIRPLSQSWGVQMVVIQGRICLHGDNQASSWSKSPNGPLKNRWVTFPPPPTKWKGGVWGPQCMLISLPATVPPRSWGVLPRRLAVRLASFFQEAWWCQCQRGEKNKNKWRVHSTSSFGSVRLMAYHC